MANVTKYIDQLTVPSGSDTITAKLVDTVSGRMKYKGETSTLPSSPSLGDTYKCTAEISIAAGSSETGSAVTANAGDLITCTSDGKWSVIAGCGTQARIIRYHETVTRSFTPVSYTAELSNNNSSWVCGDSADGMEGLGYTIGHSAADPYSGVGGFTTINGSGTGTATYTFDFSSIPSNATIDEVTWNYLSIKYLNRPSIVVWYGSTQGQSELFANEYYTPTLTTVNLSIDSKDILQSITVKTTYDENSMGMLYGMDFTITYTT